MGEDLLEELVKWSNGLINEEAAKTILKALKGEGGKNLKLWELFPRAFGVATFDFEAYSPLSYRNYVMGCISQREGKRIVQGYLKVEGIEDREALAKFLEKKIEVRGVLGEYMSSWLGGVPLLRASLPESRFRILGEGDLTTPTDISEMLSEYPNTSENCFTAITGFIIGGNRREMRRGTCIEIQVTDLRSVSVLRFCEGDAEKVSKELSSYFKVPPLERWGEGVEIAIKAYGTLFPYTLSFYPPLRFYLPKARGRTFRGRVRGDSLNSLRGQKIEIEGGSRKLRAMRISEGIYKFGFVGRISHVEREGRGCRVSVSCNSHRINLRVFGSVQRLVEGKRTIGFWPEKWEEGNYALLPEDLVSGIEEGSLEMEGLEAFSDYVFLKVLD